MRHGVIVLSDPTGLSQASSKMYFQLFPEEVRPRTLITRDRDEIKHFAKEEGKSSSSRCRDLAVRASFWCVKKTSRT